MAGAWWVTAVENNFRDIWIHDVERSVKTRFTFDKRWDATASWSPSGEQITFYSGAEDHLHAGSYTLSKPADGTGEETRLPHEIRFPLDWSPDERYLLGSSYPGGDIWYAERKDNNTYEAAPFLQAPSRLRAAQFSPTAALWPTRRMNRAATKSTSGVFPMAAARGRCHKTAAASRAGVTTVKRCFASRTTGWR